MATEDSEVADKRLPVKESTKHRMDERKPDGVTYDHFIRQLLRGDA